MKAAILGGGGQLGHELRISAPACAEVETLSHSDLDITDAAAVHRRFGSSKPEVVLNAAAYTAVDKAESEPKSAFRVNAAGVRTVADACAAIGARLVHFSTDFVFDGSATAPYRVDAPTAPLGVYGTSKRDGELAVLATLPDDGIVVRTSWLYSEHGRNFVKTMLRLMSERDRLAVVGDQTGTPTWASGLALVAWRLIELEAPGGTYHWSDLGPASWFDFAVAIQEIGIEAGVLNHAIPLDRITTAEYPTAAARPAFSVLDCSATAALTGIPQAPWRDNLRRMIVGMNLHE